LKKQITNFTPGYVNKDIVLDEVIDNTALETDKKYLMG